MYASAILTAYSGHKTVTAEPVIPTASVQQIDKTLTVTQPTFPDQTANYQATVVEPAKQAEAARVAAVQAAQLTALVPTVHTGDVEQWRGLVAQYFPAGQVEYALAIMRCESGGNPNARGDMHLTFAGGAYGYSVGLFQIRQLPGRPSTEWLLNPENNVKHAYGMWASSGWAPWSCSRRV